MKTAYLKYSKKLLSVFLSLLMIFTSISIGFVVASAEDEDPFTALAEAMKSDTVAMLTNPVYYTYEQRTVSGSGSNAYNANEYVITLPRYAEYTEAVELFNKLDAAVKATDEWSKASVGSHDESGGCTNAAAIKDELIAQLQAKGLTADDIAKNNINTFLGYVLSMDQVAYTHGNTTTTQNDVSARVFDITTVTTNDYQGYLATINSYEDVENNIVLGVKWVLTMSRENYTTSDGCNNTNHYHYAANTNHAEQGAVAVTANITNDTVKPTLTAHADYLAGLVDYDMNDLLEMENVAEFQATLQTEYDRMVDYVGGSDTYAKLFGDILLNLIKSCDTAKEIESYLELAEQYMAFVNDHPQYGVFSYPEFTPVYDQMIGDYNEFCAIYDAISEGGQAVLDYLETNEKITLEYYRNFTNRRSCRPYGRGYMEYPVRYVDKTSYRIA